MHSHIVHLRLARKRIHCAGIQARARQGDRVFRPDFHARLGLFTACACRRPGSLTAAFGWGTIGVGFGSFASGQPHNSRVTSVKGISRFMLSPDAGTGCARINDRRLRMPAPVANAKSRSRPTISGSATPCAMPVISGSRLESQRFHRPGQAFSRRLVAVPGFIADVHACAQRACRPVRTAG